MKVIRKCSYLLYWICAGQTQLHKKNNVNPVYLINKTNGYIGESNGRDYSTLVPTDESRSMKKKTTKRTIQRKPEILLDQ